MGGIDMSRKLLYSDRLGMQQYRWKRGLKKALYGLTALVFTVLLPLAEAFKIDIPQLFSPDPELFPDEATLKGVSSPTLESLELTNQESEKSLEIFFENRESECREDRALAEGGLLKTLRNEQGTASRETIAYLLALHGQYYLDGGDWKAAVAQLEEADRRLMNDPHIQSLLLRAYEAASLSLQDSARPWPVKVQEQIRNFSRKAAELRRDLRRQVSSFLIDSHQVRSVARSGREETVWLRGTTHLNFASFTARHQANRFSSAPTPRRVLAVGIDNYGRNTGLRTLAHAGTDAQRVAAAYVRLDYQSRVLQNEQATRENILQALARETLTSQTGDEFLFYYSGHGFTDRHNRGVLTIPSSLTSTVGTLTLAEVGDILSFHKGKVTILIDACLEHLDLDAGPPASDPVRGSNRPTFILASAPGGIAIESKRLGAGLYTHTLLDYLDRTAAAPWSKTGKIDVGELYNVTATATTELARERYNLGQFPKRLIAGEVLSR